MAEQLRQQIASIPAYRACLEWAHHQSLGTLTAPEVGAFWHEHYPTDLGTEAEKEIASRAACFLQLAAGASLGEFVTGRRGQPSRLIVDTHALEAFFGAEVFEADEEIGADEDFVDPGSETSSHVQQPSNGQTKDALGQAIFIGHGKNKKPLEQLQRILHQFKVPHLVAVEEPNLGRPISEKVRQTMQGCNCAILLFTADEEFRDKDGEVVYRPSQNVIHELGATSYLYGNRIVVLKEDCIDLPTNFRDIGYISFAKDQLDAKAMDVLRELIGFGIIKVTT